MEEVLTTLKKLKGLLLLSPEGEVYLLREWEIENRKAEWVKTPAGFFTFWAPKKKEEVSYISSIHLTHLEGDIVFTYKQQPTLIKRVNEMIDDRSRYLTLQRSLKKIGARITTQK